MTLERASQIKPKVLDVVCCPSCKKRVIHKKSRLVCVSCGAKYEVRNGVPIMMTESIPQVTGEVKRTVLAKSTFSRLVRKLHHVISSYPGQSYKTAGSRNRIRELVQYQSQEAYLLNIGSGTTKYREDIVNFDIEAFDNINIVGDACKLPILSESIDLILLQGVIQYLWEPERVIREIHRVLKIGGIVYCEAPFLQGLTNTADLHRYSISGIERLFKDFKMIKKGVVVGPSSALTWMLRIYLPLLFSFGNRYLYLFWEPVFGWLTTPIKYLDFFLEQKEISKLIASGFFFEGQKV